MGSRILYETVRTYRKPNGADDEEAEDGEDDDDDDDNDASRELSSAHVPLVVYYKQRRN